MSPRRRVETDVPETEDLDGYPRDGGSRRMSRRRRIETDVPETEVPDGWPQDGGSRRMPRRRRIETDVPETEDPDGCPRDGGSRRMSPRRRIQTYVPETEDPDRSLPDGRPGRTGTEIVPEMEGPDGWAPTILAFHLRDIHVCHLPWPYVWRRMSQTDVPETDDRDGGPRRMQQ